MFGLFGKKKPTENAVIRYLNDADDHYLAMYKNRDVTLFQNYCCPKLAVKLKDMIDDHIEKEVGIKKYRHREWKVIERGEIIYAYQKDIIHDDIKLSGSLRLPLGDEFHEVWKIQREKTPSGFIVLDIQDVEGEDIWI